MNNLLRNFILPAIHLAFLVPVFFHFSWRLTGLSLALLVGILAFYFYKHEVQLTHKTTINFLIPIGMFFGGFTTFFLHHNLALGAGISAGTIGLIGSFSNHLPIKNSATLPAIIYCGTFVGMSAELTDFPMVFVALACLFSSVFYQLTEGKLNGIGGKLGSVAFGGVFFAYFIVQWI